MLDARQSYHLLDTRICTHTTLRTSTKECVLKKGSVDNQTDAVQKSSKGLKGFRYNKPCQQRSRKAIPLERIYSKTELLFISGRPMVEPATLPRRRVRLVLFAGLPNAWLPVCCRGTR